MRFDLTDQAHAVSGWKGRKTGDHKHQPEVDFFIHIILTFFSQTSLNTAGQSDQQAIIYLVFINPSILPTVAL